jgi:lipoate-protein ligase A
MYLFRLDRQPGFLSMLLFHELAYQGVEALVVVSPAQPLISIGYFQDPAQEVNLEYLDRSGLRLFRREVGGGTVYLDTNQIFYQVIYRADNPRMPNRIQETYQLLSQPALETHRRFGIEASFREVNDLVTREGRKIGGEGGGNIGPSMAFVGSMMLDFDYRTMSQVARIPDEKWRDKLYRTIEENVTTMRRELGEMPDRYDVRDVLVEEFRRVLGPLEEVALPAALVEKALQRGQAMQRPDFLFASSARAVNRIRVSSTVSVVFGSHKAPGGLIRTTQEVIGPLDGGRIEGISLSGDFTLVPKESLHQRLEPSLVGSQRCEEDLRPRLEDFIASKEQEMPGVSAEDLLQAMKLEGG